MSRQHTDREYEQELHALRDSLLLMAGRVEVMIADATRALVERDVNLAKETIAQDHQVNRAELDIDDACLVLLAKRQPMASDLRFVSLAMKMVTDIERIGDLAVNICERAVDLSGQRELTPSHKLEEMSGIVRSMVRDAIDAFVERDESKARAVIARDASIDVLYTQAFRELLQQMLEDRGAVERGIHLQSVAKWFERMADHATNLAEQVVFMIKGKDIRHGGKLARPAEPPKA